MGITTNVCITNNLYESKYIGTYYLSQSLDKHQFYNLLFSYNF